MVHRSTVVSLSIPFRIQGSSAKRCRTVSSSGALTMIKTSRSPALKRPAGHDESRVGEVFCEAGVIVKAGLPARRPPGRVLARRAGGR
jgi:hypothetical protein